MRFVVRQSDSGWEGIQGDTEAVDGDADADADADADVLRAGSCMYVRNRVLNVLLYSTSAAKTDSFVLRLNPFLLIKYFTLDTQINTQVKTSLRSPMSTGATVISLHTLISLKSRET